MTFSGCRPEQTAIAGLEWHWERQEAEAQVMRPGGAGGKALSGNHVPRRDKAWAGASAVAAQQAGGCAGGWAAPGGNGGVLRDPQPNPPLPPARQRPRRSRNTRLLSYPAPAPAPAPVSTNPTPNLVSREAISLAFFPETTVRLTKT